MPCKRTIWPHLMLCRRALGFCVNAPVWTLPMYMQVDSERKDAEVIRRGVAAEEAEVKFKQAETQVRRKHMCIT